MDLPVDGFAGAFLPVDAVDLENGSQLVGLRYVGNGRLFGGQHQYTDTQNGNPETDLDNIGGQGQTYHGADYGAARSDQGHRDGQPQARQTGTQQSRTGGQRTGKGDEQTGPPDEVEMERKEAADDRHKQHAAAYTAQHGNDPHDKGHHQQDYRPVPPGAAVLWHPGSRRGFSAAAAGQGSSGPERKDRQSQQSSHQLSFLIHLTLLNIG